MKALDERALYAELAAHPLFGPLGAGLHRDLLGASAIHHLDPGELLYVAGDVAEHVFAVLKGVLQIEYPPPKKTRGYAAAILTAPCLLGECQALHQKPWSGTGVALAPLVALVVPVGALERLVLAHAAFGLVLYRELARRFLGAIESWKRHLDETPEEALARYLVGYVDALRRAGIAPGDRLRVRQADLGRATGLRRETINRVLKAWTKAGWLKVEPRGLSGIEIGRIEAVLSSAIESIDPGRAPGSRTLVRTASRRRASGRR